MARLWAQWITLGLIALAASRTLTYIRMRTVTFGILTLFAVLAYTDHRRKQFEAQREGESETAE